jgi:hypothetical protein
MKRGFLVWLAGLGISTLANTTTALPASALEDDHIKQIEAAVVKHICSDSAWLACWGEKPASCNAIIGKVANTCLGQYLPGVKQNVQYEQARAAGLKIIKCINDEFSVSRPFGKKDTPECQEVPTHLR